MSDVIQFGMVVIGDELLGGKRSDKHLPHVIEVLQARGMQVAWSIVVGDHLRRTQPECRLTRSQAVNAR